MIDCGSRTPFLALVYPSGTCAVVAVTQLLQAGDHAILFDSVYHGTRTYLSICSDLERINVSFVDLRDHHQLEKHIRDNTKMVWIETPSNPTMKMIDIAAVAAILKKYPDIFLAVDNTFMTPYCQNPLLLGADIAMHSLTKYMNGHTDVLMGAIATSNDTLYEKLQVVQA
ncbi:cystathionine gamma-lyase-like, partial [Uloborus diversus]|uniref:cystathionine gamma-lyase-like n=1 Tax=Uloborus diversus TaxID=327109 RepID=UPI00240A9C31